MVGLNDERFGERFFSLANAYDAEYPHCYKSGERRGFPLTERRVRRIRGRISRLRRNSHDANYWWDVVGMSVVPEVISARHCELKVVAVSAITNMAEGLSDVKLSHAQTLAAAELSKAKLY